MAPKKQPTNSDLYRKIEEFNRKFGKELKTVGEAVVKLDGRMSAVEERHRLIDISKEAVARYKKEQEDNEINLLHRKEETFRIQVWKKAIYVLGIAGLILAAYAASKGIK